MKLSFYYARYYPTALRIAWRLLMYAAVNMLWVYLVFSPMKLAFTSMGPNAVKLSNCLLVLVGVFTMYLLWRNEIDLRLCSMRKMILGLFLILFFCGTIYHFSFSGYRHSLHSNWWHRSDMFKIAVTLPSMFFLFIRGIKQCSDYNGLGMDEKVISFSSFTYEVKRFELMFFSTMLLYCLIQIIDCRELIQFSIMRFLMFRFLLIMFAFWWLWIWRKEVFASTRRALVTILLVLIVLNGVFGFLGSTLLAQLFPRYYLPRLAIILIAVITSILLRRSNTEAIEYFKTKVLSSKLDFPIYCSVCHYNMTGLSKATCPECGTEFVIGRLVEENVYLRDPDLWLN